LTGGWYEKVWGGGCHPRRGEAQRGEECQTNGKSTDPKKERKGDLGEDREIRTRGPRKNVEKRGGFFFHVGGMAYQSLADRNKKRGRSLSKTSRRGDTVYAKLRSKRRWAKRNWHARKYQEKEGEKGAGVRSWAETENRLEDRNGEIKNEPIVGGAKRVQGWGGIESEKGKKSLLLHIQMGPTCIYT